MVLTSGDSDRPGARKDEPAPTSSTTTEPIVSTTAFVGTATGPVFGAPVDALVLLGGSNADWRLLDPDTGTLHVVPELQGVSAADIVPVRGGVVIKDDEFVVYDGFDSEAVTGFGKLAFVALPSGEVHPLEPIALAPEMFIADVIPSGDPDRVWILHGAQAGGLHASLVGVDGQALGVAFSVAGSVRGATTRGLAVNAGGDAFLVAGEDDVAKLGAGDILATTADEVALLTCDSTIACSVNVVNVQSGQGRGGPVVEGADAGSLFVSLSPDGTLVTLPQGVGSSLHVGRSDTLSLTGPSGSTTSIDLVDLGSTPVWLPHDLGVLVIANGGVVRVHTSAGSLNTEQPQALRPDQADTLFVVPR